ncbi:MAG: oligopeptide transport system ATP-binding protein [Thermosediminibacterales bacterium]|nr:oligopeptide transport system ATP-binding protein [Thermosediminibacterales bacterium]MDK2836422.1 oligopeptide transport system ATP-binding protein [Thermosediminibacterales bacterium]
MEQLLKVENLKVSFFTDEGEIRAVDGISFDIEKGSVTAIVGESGCGKTVTALAIMGLIQPPGKIIDGSIMYQGKELIKMNEAEYRKIRGAEITMMFQNPKAALNPLLTVGKQLTEVICYHKKVNRLEAKRQGYKQLRRVGISEPERVMRCYPHELSGGMAQKVMMAIALSCNPKLLIADEPTSSIDVISQAVILEMLKNLKSQTEISVLIITHDITAASILADKIIVIYAGKVVESGNKERVLNNPQHPYTRGLLNSAALIKKGKHLEPIKGNPVNCLNLPKGCRFSPRCSQVMKICLEREPILFDVKENHKAACWSIHPFKTET